MNCSVFHILQIDTDITFKIFQQYWLPILLKIIMITTNESVVSSMKCFINFVIIPLIPIATCVYFGQWKCCSQWINMYQSNDRPALLWMFQSVYKSISGASRKHTTMNRIFFNADVIPSVYMYVYLLSCSSKDYCNAICW